MTNQLPNKRIRHLTVLPASCQYALQLMQPPKAPFKKVIFRCDTAVLKTKTNLPEPAQENFSPVCFAKNNDLRDEYKDTE